MALVRGRLSPHPPEAWPRHAACAVAADSAYLTVWLDDRCRWCDVPRGPPWVSKRATQRGEAEGTLAAMPARMLGVADAQGMRRWAYGAVDGAFSPWPGWGREGVAHGEERAQVGPLREAVQGRTGKQAAPVNVSRASRRRKARRRKRCVRRYGSGGSGHSARSASGKPRKTVADRSKKSCSGSKPSGPLPGSGRHTVVWGCGGSALPHALRHFWRSPQSISGSVDS